jgi:hypothetical protein
VKHSSIRLLQRLGTAGDNRDKASQASAEGVTDPAILVQSASADRVGAQSGPRKIPRGWPHQVPSLVPIHEIDFIDWFRSFRFPAS